MSPLKPLFFALLLGLSAAASSFADSALINESDVWVASLKSWRSDNDFLKGLLKEKNDELKVLESKDLDADKHFEEARESFKEVVKQTPNGIRESLKSTLDGELSSDLVKKVRDIVKKFLSGETEAYKGTFSYVDAPEIREKISSLKSDIDRLEKHLELSNIFLNASEQRVNELNTALYNSIINLNNGVQNSLTKTYEAQERRIKDETPPKLHLYDPGASPGDPGDSDSDPDPDPDQGDPDPPPPPTPTPPPAPPLPPQRPVPVKTPP